MAINRKSRWTLPTIIAVGLTLVCTAANAQVSTTTSLTSNAPGNAIQVFQLAALTASIAPSAGPPPSGGTVAFSDGGTTLPGCASVAVVINGPVATASCLAPFSTAGVHFLMATYSGFPPFQLSASLPYDLTVTSVTPTVTVQPASSHITTAQSLSVTVTVSAGNGNPTPTGTVTLSSGAYASSPATLSSGSAILTVPANSLSAGSDTLTASYSPDVSSASSYSTATGLAPVTVTQTIGSCTTPNPNPNPNPESFAAPGDFNGDCKSDILWRNSTTGQVYEWLMNGTTYPASGSPGSPTSDWVIQGTGDFNADGYADILWRNSTTGEVYIWLMNGTTFTSSGSLGYVSSDWSIAGVGDFNGDGKADILWWNSTTGQVYIWFINGTTMSGGGSVSYVSDGWTIAGIGDFNGDGMADIAWRNTTTGQVYIWLINGSTLTSSGSLGYVSSDWTIAGVGDFDGDGKSDILWRNTSGQVYLWLINGTAISGGGSVSYVPSAWVIQGVGDYDGSGRAGILWRNTSTEQVYIWLMNGTAIVNTGSPGAPDVTWQTVAQVGITAGSAPNIPKNAISVSSIQTLSSWIAATDTGSGSGGGASGTMNLVTSPSYGGEKALQFVTSFTNSGDERYSTVFGNDTTATNFIWDGWIYLDQSVTNIANLEMDMNQVLANGQTVIYGVQCDGYSGTWDYTINAGTPQIPVDRWVHSNAPCNVQNWSTQTWHHVQMQYSRDSLGNVTYQSVWLDGVQSAINATVPSAFALGWGQVLLTNFEVDGSGASGSSTVYLDDLTVYRW
jgi:hypothetical protein